MVRSPQAPRFVCRWTLFRVNGNHVALSLALSTMSFQTLKRISKDFSPEADFEARGMTKESFPGRYMYRDYGLKYWDATHTWVKEYMDVSALLLFLSWRCVCMCFFFYLLV